MGHDEKKWKNKVGSIEVIFSNKSLSGKIIYLIVLRKWQTRKHFTFEQFEAY